MVDFSSVNSFGKDGLGLKVRGKGAKTECCLALDEFFLNCIKPEIRIKNSREEGRSMCVRLGHYTRPPKKNRELLYICTLLHTLYTCVSPPSQARQEQM